MRQHADGDDQTTRTLTAQSRALFRTGYWLPAPGYFPLR
jgi:hypothetical protein